MRCTHLLLELLLLAPLALLLLVLQVVLLVGRGLLVAGRLAAPRGHQHLRKFQFKFHETSATCAP